jgi:hypothetical protein
MGPAFPENRKGWVGVCTLKKHMKHTHMRVNPVETYRNQWVTKDDACIGTNCLVISFIYLYFISVFFYAFHR